MSAEASQEGIALAKRLFGRKRSNWEASEQSFKARKYMRASSQMKEKPKYSKNYYDFHS